MISLFYDNSAQAAVERISWPLNVLLPVELPSSGSSGIWGITCLHGERWLLPTETGKDELNPRCLLIESVWPICLGMAVAFESVAMPTDKVSTQDNQDIGDRGSGWKRSWSEITSKTSRLESQGAPPWLEVVTPGHGGAVLQQFPFVRRIIRYSVFPLWSRWRAWSLTSSCASAPPSQSFILSMFHGPLASAKPSLTPHFILAPRGCSSKCLFILSSNMKHPPYIVTRHCTRGWWPLTSILPTRPW